MPCQLAEEQTVKTTYSPAVDVVIYYIRIKLVNKQASKKRKKIKVQDKARQDSSADKGVSHQV